MKEYNETIFPAYQKELETWTERIRSEITAARDTLRDAEILDALMEMVGASCVIYPDGQKLVEAFAVVQPGEFDAILMDAQMPNMNGLESTRAIRGGNNPLGKTIPIIAMTAGAFSSDVQNCLDAGMDAHISKPLDTALLAKTVSHLVAPVYLSHKQKSLYRGQSLLGSPFFRGGFLCSLPVLPPPAAWCHTIRRSSGAIPARRCSPTLSTLRRQQTLFRQASGHLIITPRSPELGEVVISDEE